jgi:MauM/NapG family ferredoxin protein
MSREPIEDLPPHDRRNFFLTGLSRLVGPLSDFVESKLPIPLPIIRTTLRPPGAISEKAFLETCLRCGKCADACPAIAIALTTGDDPTYRGTPYVDPDKQACVICDELACMKVCPSGALQLVDRLSIRMGLARVEHDICIRSHGEDCTLCVDKCPLGRIAIRLDDAGRVQVIDPAQGTEGCTGCGVCQQACPTTPKSIRIHAY